MAVYNLDLNKKILEYYKGRVLKIYFPYPDDIKKPRIHELEEDEIDAMSPDEFDAYCSALDKFYTIYWPLSGRRFPAQMTPEKRREIREKERQTEIQQYLDIIARAECELAKLGYNSKR